MKRECVISAVLLALVALVSNEMVNSVVYVVQDDPLGIFQKSDDVKLSFSSDERSHIPVDHGNYEKDTRRDDSSLRHRVAGLSCAEHGGPPDEDAAEMVYWSDIPSDADFVSPFQNVGPKVKYLTFEPDIGGWNNIRMAMETAIAIAVASGRTIVWPPKQGLYLMQQGKSAGGDQKNRFSFEDFFHMQSIAEEHAAIDVISFEEFLKREVMTGNLRDKRTGKPSFPPGNATNFDGFNHRMGKTHDHWIWLRSVTTTPQWVDMKCVLAFPSTAGPEGVDRIQKLMAKALEDPTDPQSRIASYDGNPTPVDASPLERLQELRAHRNEVCIYDEALQQSKVLHLPGDIQSGTRLLVHFYAFLFFEDWRQDLWNKRFVRDHLRYIDEIQCAAARVVKEIRGRARQLGNPNGVFDAFHIRRGEFQQKETRVDAGMILANTRELMEEGSTVFIATDERDKSFFDVFRRRYNILFLDDFSHLFRELNTNYYGMLDQLIASRSRTFIGTYKSTFSGLITRIQGYHSQKQKLEGCEEGVVNSFYFIPLEHKFAMRTYKSISRPFWSREFPAAWRDIDKDADKPR